MAILGMDFRIKPHVYTVYAGLWAALTLFGLLILDLSLTNAALGGLACTLAHSLILLVHHLGHYYAAKSTGYPLREVVFWGLLGTDLYPKNEPTLSAAIHRRRASGGPLANLALSLVVAAACLLFYAEASPTVQWVLAFSLVDTFAVFTIGSFIPGKALGIETDGDIFMKYWGKA